MAESRRLITAYGTRSLFIVVGTDGKTRAFRLAPFLPLGPAPSGYKVSTTGYSAVAFIPRFFAFFPEQDGGRDRSRWNSPSLPGYNLLAVAGGSSSGIIMFLLLLPGDGAVLCYYISNVSGGVSDYKLLSV